MKQKLFSILLIIHGLITSIFIFNIEESPGVFVGWNGQSWLLTDALGAPTVQILGTLLWVISVIGFVVAGLALLTQRNEWRLMDIIASLVSLIAYILFWYDLGPVPEYWILGPVISIVTLVALVILRWPTDDYIYGIAAEI